MIYLDGHSTTPLDPRVFEVMKPYFLERFGNASRGVHRLNWEAEAGVEHARAELAEALKVHPKEIIFTSGATESNHLALLGIASHLENIERKKILSIEIEHASLLGPLELLKQRGFKIEWVKIHSNGQVDLEDYRSKLFEDVGLVSIAAANHEIGTIQNLKSLVELAHKNKTLFHTDAVQALGKIPFSIPDLGVDLATFSAHKVYGPKGVGALYVKRKNPRVELEALFWGGGQERGMRPGTPNTPGIVGFGEAVKFALLELESEQKDARELRDLLWTLLDQGIADLVRNSAVEHSLPHNLNISIPGIDGPALFGRLKNVAVSNASACLSGTQDYSQVLTVIGVPKELAKASLRFGVGRFNTETEIREAAAEIITIVKELRAMESQFELQSGGI